MKTVLQAAVLSIFLTTIATGQELAKVKVAVVRINSIVGDGNLYERVRLLTCDKDTLAAIKKLNAELKTLHQQVIDADDDVKLADLGRRVQFLNQKLNILRQRNMSGNPNLDLQTVVRKFVVDNYKDKYHMIMQQEQGMSDRAFLWKGNVQTDDITDEAGQKFREYLDAALGE
jgi:hypothetical protein